MERVMLKLRDKPISYISIFLVGTIMGIITRLTDLLPNADLWSFSSIATLFGFWIVSITIIVCCSISNKNSALNVFLYMFGMTISFYVSQYILGQFFSKFDNDGFKTNLFLIYSVLSVICGIGGYILYFWNKENKFNSFLLALPISALLAEGIGTLIYLVNNNTFLFQVMFDFICALVLGFLFYKKSNNKKIYIITMITISIIIYLIIYMPFLNI